MNGHDGPAEATSIRATRVVVADDHPRTRARIRAALEADGFEVVAEEASARSTVEAAVALRPDVCLVDVHMPGGGIAAAAALAKQVPETAVVMLTHSRGEEDLFESLRAGARGYLLKDMNPQRLGAALRGVLDGEGALPRTLLIRLFDEFRSSPRRRVVLPGRRPAELTSREWEVCELLRKGLSNEQVAERLFLSPGTVRVHVSNVLRKLGAEDRATALRLLERR